MTQPDLEEFALMLGAVYEFYSKTPSASALEIWWAALKPFDLAAVRRALGQHALNPDRGQFIPKPADVVLMLGGSTLDSGLVAWSKFEQALHSIGPYRSVVFDDPIIHRVVEDMGGWTALARCSGKDWPFKQNEFVNRYRSFRMRGETPAYPPKLVGISEAENSVNGWAGDERAKKEAEPVLIGDSAAAVKVLAGGSTTARLEFNRLSDVAKQIEAKP